MHILRSVSNPPREQLPRSQSVSSCIATASAHLFFEAHGRVSFALRDGARSEIVLTRQQSQQHEVDRRAQRWCLHERACTNTAKAQSGEGLTCFAQLTAGVDRIQEDAAANEAIRCVANEVQLSREGAALHE